MTKKSKKNSAYWRDRFEKLEDEQYQHSVAYYQDLQKQFRIAQNGIQMDIERWYQRLAENNDITYSAARKLLKKDELEEFHWSVKKYIKKGTENAVDQRWMKQLENASAKVHISRLEAMKISIQQHAELLYTRYEGGITDFLEDSYKNSYYHMAYEVAKGTGAGVNLHTIDTRKIDILLNQPWAADGANFSDRIWKNKEKLVNTLHTELSQGIIRGEDPRQAIDNIAKTMKISKNQAGRLVMTESAAISAAAAKECYKDLGLEQYQILATLDNLTSEICREMDGKVFSVSEYEIGVTAPPFHPWCRSTTIPYFSDEFTEGEMRAARNEDTGKTYYVPADMTYPEWTKEYVGNKGLSAGKEKYNIPQHNKPSYLKTVDARDKGMIESVLKEYEQKIAKSSIENAIAVLHDGRVVQCFGTLNGVYPDIDLDDALDGAYVTHNHPNGSNNEFSFSDADIQLFMKHNLSLLRGIDEKYIYELTRNPDEIDENVSLAELMESDGELFRHEHVIDIARKYGIGYRRWKR